MHQPEERLQKYQEEITRYFKTVKHPIHTRKYLHSLPPHREGCGWLWLAALLFGIFGGLGDAD
jgi:hypothetical protein